MSTLSKFVNAAKNPFLQLAKAYNRTAQKSPLGTGMVTTVVKTSAADLFAQKVSKIAYQTLARDGVPSRGNSNMVTGGGGPR